MAYDSMEDDKEWLFKCREEGHLTEWDIAGVIDRTQDIHELRDMLKFLIVEGMIKVWEPEKKGD